MRTFSLSSREEETDSKEALAILEGLNPSQQEAASTTEGAVMIIAGAGSGKTRSLTFRIAYLLATKKAWPSQILALTFTNKAAREMKERIVKLVGEETSKGIWMGTFHSIFARILRREAEKIGFTSDFSIYDSEDSERVVRNLMNHYGLDTKQLSPKAVFHRISSAKNQLVSPHDYNRLANTRFDEVASSMYQPYLDTLKKSNAMDFDDLLVKTIELFEKHPETLASYQNRWKYIHIDEYQDTNHAQYTLAKMLAMQHKNICVVGDDAQSIYAFRGADITNILNFQKDYKEAKVVRLEQNYRSTQKILQLADSVIKQNRDQLEKTLWTENPEGDFITLFESLSERDEAQRVEQAIRHIYLNFGIPYDGFAVLYRTNAQSRSLEDAMRRANIPYRLVGGVNFYQRREIKDALAYLRLVVNPNDNESLRRIINYPKRGIGDTTLQKIQDFAREQGVSIWQALERIDEAGLGRRATSAIEKFQFMIAQHASKLSTLPADELARSIIAGSGLLVDLRQENTIESLARWENVQELLNAIAEYTANSTENATLSTFLQEVTLLTDQDTTGNDDGKVTLMTLHASKGLEFPVVFLTGLEENLFPLQAATQHRKDLEEERRLLYVGITRAQEKLFLSYARSRFRYGQYQPSVSSRFLDEIDTSVIRTDGGKSIQKHQRFSTSSVRRDSGFDDYLSQVPPKELSFQKASTPAPKKKGERTYVYDDAVDNPQIVPGMRVAHPTFGEGKVLSMEGSGERAKATVFFKSVGQKKLVLKFANLRVV